ncbi:MAG: hypothetical protein QF578_13135 [Alphaproteobacteria bacterium]|jgi:hypothetical protein|nr:hypothetical protein [Alphaproteobacteria bacterium]
MSEAAVKAKPKQQVAVRFYKVRNALRERAAGGAAPSKEGGSISVEALQAAESEFEKMSEDYPDWVQGLIKQLYEGHRRCVDTPELRHEHFATINEIAHDMKGQGGTFGYPLISHFGESLYESTKSREDYTDNQVELMKAHVDGMKAVISGRVSGDGGDIGKELIASLGQAIQKYADDD